MHNHNLPKFKIDSPEIITANLRQLLDKNRRVIAELLVQPQPFSWDNLLRPIEALDDKLHQFWSPISHLNGVMNSPALREAYNAGLPLLTEYQTEIGHNQALYQAICQIAESETYATLDPAQ